MARFYTNENFPLRTTLALRKLGHDVLTSQESGQANRGIPDDEVLAFSVAQNRILLTLNRRDFIRLHRSNSSHCGIVICTGNADFDQMAVQIEAIIRTIPNPENQLIRVYKS